MFHYKALIKIIQTKSHRHDSAFIKIKITKEHA